MANDRQNGAGESAEGIVIKNLCTSKEVRDKYLHRISKSDFAYHGHDKIYQAVCNKHQAGEKVTRETLAAALPEEATLRIMVSLMFERGCPELTEEVFSQFKRSGAKNRLTQMRKYIEKKENDLSTDPAAVVEAVRNMLDRVDDGDNDMEYVFDMEQTADSTMEMIEHWSKGEVPYQFQIPEVDDDLFLSQLTGYVVIGGESGGGKTGAMLHIAKMNSVNGGLKTGIATLEMRKEMLLFRMATESPKLKGKRLTIANLKNPKYFDDIRFAVDYCRRFNIVIVEGISNIFSLARIFRSLAVKRNLHTAILDYLQMADTGDEKMSEVINVATCSKVWKSLSLGDKKRGVPPLVSIALSQYAEPDGKGKLDQRAPRKFRWSRQILMDADLALHLQDVDVPEGFDYEFDEHDKYIELFCEKQRNWAAGWRHPVIFHKSSQTFSSPLLDKKRKLRGFKQGVPAPVEIRL